MKSKAEIADALQTCMFTPDCKGCAYILGAANGSCKCRREMIEDIINILSKSDFEVMKEILDRSKLNAVGDVGYYSELGYNIIGISGIGVDIEFDSEGNIL